MMDSKEEWALRRHRLEVIGLNLALFDGHPIQRGGQDEEGWLLQIADPVRIGVWYGEGMDFERWREGFAAFRGVEFGPPRGVRVCGLKAERQEATVPDQAAAEGGFLDEEGKLVFERRSQPGFVAVVLAFERRGTPVLVSWQVESEAREAFRDLEKRFLTSLSCEQEPD